MFDLNPFGEDAVFDHVGIAVFSIRDVVGDKVEVTDDELQKVTVGFVDMHGLKIELVQPFGEDTPIKESLKKNQKLLHLCFRVHYLKEAMVEARKHGFHCIAQPKPAKAFQHKRIAWLFSRVYGLIELLES